jgi:flagellar basal body-associated protein FliL
MSHDHTSLSETPQHSTGILLLVGVLILLLAAVIGGLWLNSSSSATESEDADRAAVRTKNLAELQASDSNALTTYGWNDQAKGIIHIPITKAMELILPTLQASVNKAPKEVQP